MLSQIKEAARQTFHVVNLFWKNPIVDYTQPDHIVQPHLTLVNPHVAIDTVAAILKGNQGVRDALREHYGQYLLRTIVVKTDDGQFDLHANLYRLQMFQDEDTWTIWNTTGWERNGFYDLLTEVERVGFKVIASITPQKAPRGSGYYNPMDPIQSWTISLSLTQQKQLELAYT